MSDSNFSVNTDGMGPAVDGLASLGERLSQITQHLESTLDGLGKPWGEDKNGESFFKQYGTSRDQTLEGAASMADAVHGVSSGIRTMIKGYTNIDDSAKETAKNMSGDSDGSGGGGGGGGYNGDNPPASERLGTMQPRQYERARRMDALMPAERGIPATREDGTPLEPMQPLLAREGELLPETPGIPAEPLQMATRREGTLLPTEPGEPLQRGMLREGTVIPDNAPAEPFLASRREATLSPMEPLQPMERGTLREGTLAEPLQPLERVEATPAHRLLAREDSIPATPAHPLLAREEAIPATPAHRLLAREDSIPATPVQESRWEAASAAMPGEPAKFVRSEAPLAPLQPAEGRVTYPTHEGTPVEPLQPVYRSEHLAQPLQPAYISERPAEPLQPTHMDRLAEPLQPMQPRLLEPVQQAVPAIPAEPSGFAELEPERYTPMEPQIPAVPEQ